MDTPRNGEKGRARVSSRYAVLPTRDAVLLPGAVNELNVGRPGSVAALRFAAEREERVLLLLQRDLNVDDPDGAQLHPVGTLCRITHAERSSADFASVTVASEERARVSSTERSGGVLFAEVEALPWAPAEPELSAALREVLPTWIESLPRQLQPPLITNDIQRLCVLSVAAPLEPTQLQAVLEREELALVAKALDSLRDKSWRTRLLRWIRR